MGIVIPRQRNSQDKQQRLLDAALELFAEQGLEGASTANIAKRAGVANGTLFHHFSSKQKLITRLYLRVKQEVADALLAVQAGHEHAMLSHQQQLFLQWLSFMQWSVTHPNKLRFIVQYSHSAYIEEETRYHALFGVFGFVVEYLRQGQQQGAIAAMDETLLMDMVESMVLGAASHFIAYPERLRDTGYAEQAFNLLWRAIVIE